MSKGEGEYADYSEALRKLENMLMELEIQGVPNISKVFIREEKSDVCDFEGGTGYHPRECPKCVSEKMGALAAACACILCRRLMKIS